MRRRIFKRLSILHILCALMLLGILSLYMQSKSKESNTDVQTVLQYGDWIYSKHGEKVNVVPLKVLQYSEGQWTFREDVCSKSQPRNKTFVKLKHHKLSIAIHEDFNDKWINKELTTEGEWKGKWSGRVIDLLKEDTDSVFIDIGSHIGTFTLPAAITGRPVIAIDCLKQNLELLCISLENSPMKSKVSIVYNAVSQKQGKAIVKTPEENFGGSFIEPVFNRIDNDPMQVETIVLEDLLDEFQIRKAVIKMSVEGHELAILKGAAGFFKKVYVKYVIMEFSKHRRQLSALKIRGIMREYDMEPVLNSNFTKQKTFIKWPSMILWRNLKPYTEQQSERTLK